MSSMELNKIVAAVLLAGVIAMTTGFVAELLVAPEELEENAFLVATEGGEAVVEEEEEEQVPLAVLLASADPAEGESFVRACASCHSFDQGGADRIGPHLWGVLGRDKGGVEGFNYSSAMQAAEGEWTYEALDGFLHQPRNYLSGTSMSYAGIRDAEDRANVIAYLRTLSEDPLPLPEPPAEEPAAEEGAAAAEAATAEAELEAEDLAEDGSTVMGPEEAEEAAADTEPGEPAVEGQAPGQQPGELATGTGEDEIELQAEEAEEGVEEAPAAEPELLPELLEEETGEALTEGAAGEAGELGPARGAPTDVDVDFVPVPEEVDPTERVFEPAVPGSMGDEPGPVGSTPAEEPEGPLEPPVTVQEGLAEEQEVEVEVDPDDVIAIEPGEPGQDITEEVIPADRGPPE